MIGEPRYCNQLWLADTATWSDDVAETVRLSGPELDRVARMSPAAARRFRLARLLARFALGRNCAATDRGDDECGWALAPRGATRIVNAPAGVGPVPHVSLAHSRQFLAFAISDTAVGCDIEQHRPHRPFLALANAYFARPEWAALCALPLSEACRHFYRLWTMKEAVAKATATPLIVSLRSACPAGWRVLHGSNDAFHVAVAAQVSHDSRFELEVNEVHAQGRELAVARTRWIDADEWTIT